MLEQWFNIEDGGLGYRVRAASKEHADRLFSEWKRMPVEVEWLERTWAPDERDIIQIYSELPSGKRVIVANREAYRALQAAVQVGLEDDSSLPEEFRELSRVIWRAFFTPSVPA